MYAVDSFGQIFSHGALYSETDGGVVLPGLPPSGSAERGVVLPEQPPNGSMERGDGVTMAEGEMVTSDDDGCRRWRGMYAAGVTFAWLASETT
jgi:hypothetical protein